jgi:hypothetical protein
MESISNYELIQLVQNGLALIDSHFQHWISVSFATVVAGFLARDVLDWKARAWFSILYLVASSFFATKYYIQLQQLLFIGDELLDRSISWPSDTSRAVSLRASLFFLGLLSILWFINFDQRWPLVPRIFRE